MIFLKGFTWQHTSSAAFCGRSGLFYLHAWAFACVCVGACVCVHMNVHLCLWVLVCTLNWVITLLPTHAVLTCVLEMRRPKAVVVGKAVFSMGKLKNQILLSLGCLHLMPGYTINMKKKKKKELKEEGRRVEGWGGGGGVFDSADRNLTLLLLLSCVCGQLQSPWGDCGWLG